MISRWPFVDRVQEDATNAIGMGRATLGECDEVINIDISRCNGRSGPRVGRWRDVRPDKGRFSREGDRHGKTWLWPDNERLWGKGQMWPDMRPCKGRLLEGDRLGEICGRTRVTSREGGQGLGRMLLDAGQLRGHDATIDQGLNEVASELARLAFLGWMLCGGRLWGNDDATD